MAAATEHRLFHVAEMLEAILVELPTKDLLLSQAVCKMWRNTIQSSTKLQKALFLMPDGEGRLIIDDNEEICKDPKTVEPSATDPTPNPVLKNIIQAMYWGDIEFDKKGRVVLPKRYTYFKSCWKRMLITQPAMSSLYLRTEGTTSLMEGYRYYDPGEKVVNPRGITMGDLVESLGRARCDRRVWDKMLTSYIDIASLWDLCNEELDGMPTYCGGSFK